MKTNRHLLIALASALPAILSASPAKTAAAPASTNQTAPGKAPAYTLHEWGTFTTVSGSNGMLLPGLQREEEALPTFVYAHEGMQNQSSFLKGYLRPLAGVTVKMETPIIYFYTPEPFHARVEVGFGGGSISQWFPERSGGEIPPELKRNIHGQPLFEENKIDFSKGYQGRIEWEVDITPPGEDISGRVFKAGDETPNWLHPRQPNSALVSTAGGDAEKYLFYRGVGRFDLPVVFTTGADGRLHIRNQGNEAIPALLVFNNVSGAEPKFQKLGPLSPGASTSLAIDQLPLPSKWSREVYEEGAKMLVGAGLHRAEADAMMQTWWNSYFEQAGLRVFWIVPEKFTEQILPLKVTPAPAKSVRVLVGRSEILTPAFEERILADFKAKPNVSENPWVSDRYFLAYQARVEQMMKPAAKDKIVLAK